MKSDKVVKAVSYGRGAVLLVAAYAARLPQPPPASGGLSLRRRRPAVITNTQ